MKSPALLQATASEPLTLDEEYEMCEDWENDVGKYTFIILEGATAKGDAIGNDGFLEDR